MKNITFHCQVITPMFLSGVDKISPELRPPSIKGMLRFWWRALNSHLSIEDLRKNEAKIFGGSGEDEGRSKVVIRIGNKNVYEKDSLWSEIPHDNRTSRKGKKYKVPKKYHGISYLIYSPLMLNDDTFINVNSTFDVKIIYNENSNINLVKDVVYPFWCMSFLSGIGTRSRRGGGNISVTCDDDYQNLFLHNGNVISKKSGMKEFLSDILSTITVNQNTPTNISYSILKDSNVYVFDPKADWKDALNSIGEPFKSFRDSVKGQIKKTPNFGFPIRHRNKTLMRGGISRNGRNISKIERSSSPLIFRIIKSEQNYFPLIIWLNSKLLPNGHSIMDKHGGNISTPNNTIINDFIKTLNNYEVLTI